MGVFWEAIVTCDGVIALESKHLWAFWEDHIASQIYQFRR